MYNVYRLTTRLIEILEFNKLKLFYYYSPNPYSMQIFTSNETRFYCAIIIISLVHCRYLRLSN